MVAVAKLVPVGHEQAPTLLTLEEFYALPEGPPDHEFEEGKLIDMPRPHPRHQAILRDRVAKFNAYRQAGVTWYWLIDGESLVVEEFQLTSEGYLAIARVAAGGTFQPQLFPGLQINLANLLGETVGFTDAGQ